MKTIILMLLFLAGFAFSLQAQDKLIKKNGIIIEGKVTEVGVREVRYQINPEPNSAKFVIRKAELSHIVFGNGETFVISGRPVAKDPSVRQRVDNTEYGRNILTISPFKALDSGPGLGFSYERIVGEGQYVGIILPVSFIFQDYNVYDPNFVSNNKYFTNIYISPGVKIYPFGQRKVTYAVGPNVIAGFVKNRYSEYVPNGGGGYYYTRQSDSFRLGLVVNNYLNFQITPRINLGINGGLGMRYLDRQNSSSNFFYSDGNLQVIGEFAFNFGFRF